MVLRRIKVSIFGEEVCSGLFCMCLFVCIDALCPESESE